jgi:hypothetical protein
VPIPSTDTRRAWLLAALQAEELNPRLAGWIQLHAGDGFRCSNPCRPLPIALVGGYFLTRERLPSVTRRYLRSHFQDRQGVPSAEAGGDEDATDR